MCTQYPPPRIPPPHPSQPPEQHRRLCQTSTALSSDGRAPPLPCASHICGCSITHPLPRSCGADGGTQIPLSQGRALIAKPSRGVSPQLQHTAQLSSHRRRTLAPEAPGWREERESQVPPVWGAGRPHHAPAIDQGATVLPRAMAAAACRASSSERPSERHRSSGHGTPACVVPALLALGCLTPPHQRCSHRGSS